MTTKSEQVAQLLGVGNKAASHLKRSIEDQLGRSVSYQELLDFLPTLSQPWTIERIVVALQAHALTLEVATALALEGDRLPAFIADLQHELAVPLDYALLLEASRAVPQAVQDPAELRAFLSLAAAARARGHDVAMITNLKTHLATIDASSYTRLWTIWQACPTHPPTPADLMAFVKLDRLFQTGAGPVTGNTTTVLANLRQQCTFSVKLPTILQAVQAIQNQRGSAQDCLVYLHVHELLRGSTTSSTDPLAFLSQLRTLTLRPTLTFADVLMILTNLGPHPKTLSAAARYQELYDTLRTCRLSSLDAHNLLAALYRKHPTAAKNLPIWLKSRYPVLRWDHTPEVVTAIITEAATGTNTLVSLMEIGKLLTLNYQQTRRFLAAVDAGVGQPLRIDQILDYLRKAPLLQRTTTAVIAAFKEHDPFYRLGQLVAPLNPATFLAEIAHEVGVTVSASDIESIIPLSTPKGTVPTVPDISTALLLEHRIIQLRLAQNVQSLLDTLKQPRDINAIRMLHLALNALGDQATLATLKTYTSEHRQRLQLAALLSTSEEIIQTMVTTCQQDPMIIASAGTALTLAMRMASTERTPALLMDALRLRKQLTLANIQQDPVTLLPSLRKQLKRPLSYADLTPLVPLLESRTPTVANWSQLFRLKEYGQDPTRLRMEVRDKRSQPIPFDVITRYLDQTTHPDVPPVI